MAGTVRAVKRRRMGERSVRTGHRTLIVLAGRIQIPPGTCRITGVFGLIV